MAKLSAHGIEIGRIEYAAKTVAYFADGKTLCNCGFGWKVHGKIKAGFTPQSAFEYVKGKLAEFHSNHPASKAYHRAITEVPLSYRWKLISAMEMMGDDIDGVWSTLDDDYETRNRLSLEDIQEIYSARKAAEQEAKDLKEQRA